MVKNVSEVMTMTIGLFFKKVIKAVLPYGLLKLFRYYKSQKLLSYCPICKKTGNFKRFGVRPRPNAQCPHCGSVERHRLLWIFLQKHTDIFKKDNKKILHVAAEPFLAEKLTKIYGENYLTADLFNPRAMVKMDITDIQYSNNTFDVIICNHVLEHVIDDAKAIREFCRVLKSTGWAILLVPIKQSLEKTYEDYSITTEAGRLEAFGQGDHVRYYGRDYVDRLKSGGFKVRITGTNELAKEKEIKKMKLSKENIYYCHK